MTLQENVEGAVRHGRSVIKKYEGSDLNETTTRYAIIDPILTALGWKLDDPERCSHEEWWERKDREYPGRPDYCLHNKNGDPVVLIEAKGLSKTLNGFSEENQLKSYRPDPKKWVLTNGRLWYFYDDRTDFGGYRYPIDITDCTESVPRISNQLIQELCSLKRW